MNMPYIGVTGLTLPRHMQGIVGINTGSKGKLLAIGVLASYKTIHAQQTNERYPQLKKICRIFSPAQHCFNVIHYYSRTTDYLSRQLETITQYGGAYLGGLQVNISLPPLAELGKFKTRYPQIKLILQINKDWLQKAEGSSERLAELAANYQTVADYLLFDCSRGKGITIDVELADRCLAELSTLGDSVDLGVAGGLCAETLENIRPLIKKYPKLSWDAESGLRDDQDNFSLLKAITYLEKSFKM